MNPKLLNFLLFQVVWFVAIEGATRGQVGWGPIAAGAFVAVHLSWTPRGERRAELLYLAFITALGMLLDTGLLAIGATGFPHGGTHLGWIPPVWIASLWLAFGCLPRFSLAWMRGRPWLAASLGALGGPASYLAGARLGAVSTSTPQTWTIVALGVEYALVMPLLLSMAPANRRPADRALG
jgi:hypothetical protein